MRSALATKGSTVIMQKHNWPCPEFRRLPGALVFVAALVLVVLVGVQTCPVGLASSGAGLPWVTTSNGRLVTTPGDQPVTLRGINLAFYLDICPLSTYATESSIEELAGKGVNLVRVAFHWNQISLLPEKCAWKQSGREWLKELVGWCSDNGIYVVLDMHVPPGNKDIDPIDGAFWNSSKNADNLVGLWELIAAEFKNDPAVLGYDLFNEPDPASPDEWWNLADRLVMAIRSIDSRHLVIVEADMSGTLRKLSDPGVLYSVHFYNPMIVSHRGATWMGDFTTRTDTTYPGLVPEDVVYVGEPAPQSYVDTPSSSWRKVSTTATVPEGVNIAMASLFGWQGPMDVYFDDVSMEVNGVPVQVVNSQMSQESGETPGMPLSWIRWRAQGSSYQAALDKTTGHSGDGSLHVWGQGEWVSCGQSHGPMYDQLLTHVNPGDQVSVSAWVKAPSLSGVAGATIDWNQENYSQWDRQVLEQSFDQAFGNWAQEQGVPLFLGEFGCMSRPGDTTSTALVADMIDMWNEKGYPWTIWDYREVYRPPGSDRFSFGLVNCPDDQTPDEGHTLATRTHRPVAGRPQRPCGDHVLLRRGHHPPRVRHLAVHLQSL